MVDFTFTFLLLREGKGGDGMGREGRSREGRGREERGRERDDGGIAPLAEIIDTPLPVRSEVTETCHDIIS